jgi:hypothetical protein
VTGERQVASKQRGGDLFTARAAHAERSVAAKRQCAHGRHKVGGDYSLAAQNGVQRLARNAHPAHRLGNRQSQVLLEDLAKEFAGMRRRAIERSTDMKLCAGVLGNCFLLRWYCSESTCSALPSYDSKVIPQGPFTWIE